MIMQEERRKFCMNSLEQVKFLSDVVEIVTEIVVDAVHSKP